MKYLMSVVAACAAVVNGYAESWGSRSGDVVIADDAFVEIADSDIAAIESGVTSLTIGAGATVRYAGTGTLRVNFPISGTGAFIGDNQGSVVLLSDNSGLVSPGHFAFTNCLCVVSNEFGLGSASTGMACFQVSLGSDKANSAAAQNRRKAFSPRFGSATGVITNHVAIGVTADTNNPNINFGSESIDETLVMDADWRWLRDSNMDSVYIKGNVVFISGTFTSHYTQNRHFYTAAASGYSGKPTISMLGSSRIYAQYFFGGGVTWYFGSETAHTISCYTSTGHYIALDENMFVNTEIKPYAGLDLDLNGYDQEMQAFNFKQYGSATYASDAKTPGWLSSATPAKLILTASHAANKVDDYNKWGLQARGAAGIQFNSTDSVTNYNYFSETSGELAIAKGTFTFDRGAGWGGDVTVTGGTLVCVSPNSVSTPRGKLLIGDSGAVVIPDGIHLFAALAEIGGTEFETGEYTVAELAVTYGGWVRCPDGDTGTGVIHVTGMPEEWAGWPTEPGQVKIPNGLTVSVTDADAANVAKVTTLVFGTASTLIFSNQTETVFVNAPILVNGAADIYYRTAAPVVLNGDNSAWTGASHIDGASTVIVSNRYGLGTSSSPLVSVPATANLWFGGSGLTNDVKLSYEYKDKLRFQENLACGPFVQNASLSRGSGGNESIGDAIFNSTYSNTGGSGGPIISAGKTAVFNGQISWSGYFQPQLYGDLVLNHQNSIGSCFYTYYGTGTVYCGASGVFSSKWVQMNRGQTVDLQGYDQTIAYLLDFGNSGVGQKVNVRSETPAVLTLADASATAATGNFCFEGAVGLVYSRSGAETFSGPRSTSTGSLSVTSGTLVFSGENGWAGPDITVSGGTLRLSSPRPSESNAVVTVNGGTLEISSGTTAAMRRLVCGERTLAAAGTYTIAELTAAGYTGLAGAGSIAIIDPLPRFSAALASDESVTVTAAGDGTQVENGKVRVAAGEEIALDWTFSGGPSTRYEYKVELDGGSLEVYNGDTLVRTITESGTYDFTQTEEASLRFVAVGGDALLYGFTNRTFILIVASDSGVTIEGGVIGFNALAIGGSATIVFRRAFTSTTLATGVSLNGVEYLFADYPAGIEFSFSDAERGVFTAEVLYSPVTTEWYVDAEHGDDLNAGYHRDCPKLTLQTVIDDFAKAGDTVYLLPGVYAQTPTRVGDEKTLNRVILKAGVNITGLGPKGAAHIVGASAPKEKRVGPYTDRGLGEDAVRCLRANGNNVIRNVTLRDGRIWATASDVNNSPGNAHDGYAAIHRAGDGVWVVDSVISNMIGNVDSICSSVNFLRTRICYCQTTWYSGMQYCNYYNSIVDHVIGAYPVHQPSKVLNCTFGPGNESQGDFRSTGGGNLYNTVITTWGGDTTNLRFYRCFVAGKVGTVVGEWANKMLDGTGGTDEGITVTYDADTHELTELADNDAIDGGNYSYYEANFPAKFADEKDLDFYGNPRQSGASIDVGAVEHDWRPALASAVSQRFVCTAAKPGVYVGESGVLVPDGKDIVFGLKTGSTASKLQMQVGAENGTMTIRRNGEVVATVTGESAQVKLELADASDTLEFAYAGTGEGRLGRARTAAGAILYFR